MGRYGLRSIGQGRSHTRTQHTWVPVIRSIHMGGAPCRFGWPYAPYVRRERSLCVLPGARAGHVRAVRRGYLFIGNVAAALQGSLKGITPATPTQK